MNEQSKNTKPLHCEDFEPLVILYACDELDAGARAEVEAHAAQCAACAEVLSREGNLNQAIASLDQPADSLDRSGLLLAQCRSELAEALDDRQAKAGQPRWATIFSPATWWTVGSRHVDLSSGHEHGGAGRGGLPCGRGRPEAARRAAPTASARRRDDGFRVAENRPISSCRAPRAPMWPG